MRRAPPPPRLMPANTDHDAPCALLQTGETKWDEVEATDDRASDAETDAKIDALFAVAEPKW